MPILDYKCECGETFEVLTTIAHSLDCPKCGRKDTRRVFSVETVQTVVDMPFGSELSPQERWIKTKHKQAIEEGLRTGRIKDYDASKERMPEFRPDHQRRVY